MFVYSHHRSDPPPPHQAQSRTSRDAARRIRPTAGALRTQVLAAIISAGPRGLTDSEGIKATGIGGSTYRPRRVELARLDAIRPTGDTRRTQSGRRAVVWAAVAAATIGGDA